MCLIYKININFYCMKIYKINIKEIVKLIRINMSIKKFEVPKYHFTVNIFLNNM
jgi:predicted ATPase with chaperone activity